jgi:hypothetical protein
MLIIFGLFIQQPTNPGRIAPYFIILLCPMPGEFTGQGESTGT